jgi:MFS family permease
VTTLATPVIGRLIDRYGERRLLALNYACLIFLFAGYALVHNLIVLGVLYCLDNAFFAFSLGINSYLGRIAPLEDVTPSLVMGSTVNHIAAVGVPVVGGLLWSTVGYQVTFLAGAATCLLSVLSALAIRIEREPSPQRIPEEPLAATIAPAGHADGPGQRQSGALCMRGRGGQRRRPGIGASGLGVVAAAEARATSTCSEAYGV